MSILKPESTVFVVNLFIFSSDMLGKVVDVPKAVLIFLPIVFSHAGRSAAALDLLRAGSFKFHPQFQRRFPQENWDQLFSASYEACKLAIAAEGDNLAITMEGASDNDTERDNLAIATEGDMSESAVVTGTEGDDLAIIMDASDNAATERDNLAIATEGATGSDNAMEIQRDNLAIATEGDMSESTIVTGTDDSLAIVMDASDNAATERDNLAITAEGDKPTIPESDAEIGTSSRGSGLELLLQVVRIILELILGTFSIHL